MSIVTISQTLGSLGDEIGRTIAEALGYRYADREIILKAAAELGQGATELERRIEGKPSLWERLTDTHGHYVAAVEAVVWELAARDNAVLVGGGAAFVLHGVRHALRVRVTAPQPVRARRLEDQRGLQLDALETVRQSDRELGARVRSIYRLEWDDPLHYELVLNTERLDVRGAAALIRQTLGLDRFRATPGSLADVRDRGLTARVTAALLTHGETRHLEVFASAAEGRVTLTGRATREIDRQRAGDLVAALPGVARVVNEIVVIHAPPAPIDR